MASTGVSPCIVVGYDGSPSSCAALKPAVDRVDTGKIFLVHGYDAPADFQGGEHHDAVLQAHLRRGEKLRAGASEVETRLADVDHEFELIAGKPAEVLAAVADTRGAAEIIVGTRGFGPIRGNARQRRPRAVARSEVPRHRHPRRRAGTLAAPGDAIQRERVGG